MDQRSEFLFLSVGTILYHYAIHPDYSIVAYRDFFVKSNNLIFYECTIYVCLVLVFMSKGSLVPRRVATLSVREDGLERYLSEIRKVPILEREEEYMLARRWISHKDVEAAHRLVLSHLRLVAKIASGYRGYGLPYSELVSEGNIGLLQAVRRFDPERGFRLATYAMWWIRAAIQDYVLRSWSLVKIGTTSAQKKLFFNLRKLRQQMRALDSNQITADEIGKIASTLEVEAKDVEMMHARLSSRDLSLQTPVGDDGDAWQEWIADEEEDHEKMILDQEESRYRRAVLADALETLKPRERDIFCSRRLDDPVATLDSLSKRYNVSRERIRQIEASAFEKLRKAVELEEQRHIIEPSKAVL